MAYHSIKPDQFIFIQILDSQCNPSSSPSQTLHINFKFSFEFEYLKWVEHIGSVKLVPQGEIAKFVESAVVNLDLERFSFKEVSKFIKKMLDQEHLLSERWRDHVTSFAWKHLCKTVSSSDSGCYVVDLEMVVFIQTHLFGFYFESDGCDLREDSCPICLEDLPAGDQSPLVLPCSHVFHVDCMEKCQETSTCCPLCRRETPRFREYLGLLHRRGEFEAATDYQLDVEYTRSRFMLLK